MKYLVIAAIIFGTALACFGVYALFSGVVMIRDSGRMEAPTSGTIGLIYTLIAILAFGCAAFLFYWASASNKSKRDE